MGRIGTISSGDVSFSNCDFISCNNNQNSPRENGGAISYLVSNGNLTVTLCYFYRCIAYSMQGGAIDARYANDVIISSSTFVHCEAYAATTYSGGGAVDLWYINKQLSISLCSFVSCFSKDDGGAAAIWSSSATDNQIVCQECRFINGAATGSSNACGGGIILWDNSNVLKCTNILFALNTASYGGAYATNNIYVAPHYILSFCFFNRNTGTYGNDIYFLSWPSYSPFLYCFSTSESDRIGYYSSEYQTTDADWFPQTSITIKLTRSRTPMPQSTHTEQ